MEALKVSVTELNNVLEEVDVKIKRKEKEAEMHLEEARSSINRLDFQIKSKWHRIKTLHENIEYLETRRRKPRQRNMDLEMNETKERQSHVLEETIKIYKEINDLQRDLSIEIEKKRELEEVVTTGRKGDGTLEKIKEKLTSVIQDMRTLHA